MKRLFTLFFAAVAMTMSATAADRTLDGESITPCGARVDAVSFRGTPKYEYRGFIDVVLTNPTDTVVRCPSGLSVESFDSASSCYGDFGAYTSSIELQPGETRTIAVECKVSYMFEKKLYVFNQSTSEPLYSFTLDVLDSSTCNLSCDISIDGSETDGDKYIVKESSSKVSVTITNNEDFLFYPNNGIRYSVFEQKKDNPQVCSGKLTATMIESKETMNEEITISGLVEGHDYYMSIFCSPNDYYYSGSNLIGGRYHIVFSATDGIRSVTTSGDDAMIYSVDGMHQCKAWDELPAGVYIVKDKDGMKKVRK